MQEADIDPRGAPALAQVTRTDRRLLTLSSLTFASRALGRLSGAVLVVALARLLAIDEFAAYSYLIALVGLLVVIGDTGVPLLASREVAAGRAAAGAVFWAAVPIVLAGGALTATAFVLFGLVDAGPGTSGVTLTLAAGIVLARAHFVLVAALLRGLGRLKLEAGLQFGGSVAFVVAAASAALTGLGVTGVLAVLLVKDAGSLVVAFAAVARDAFPPVPPRRVLALLRRGLRIGVATAALAVLTKTPLLLLANTATAPEVARFAAPFRLADAALFVSIAAGFALLPGLAHVGETEEPRALRLIRRSTGAALALALAASAALVPLARPLMAMLFGAEFERAADPARVLLAGLPVYAVVGLGWYALLALERERFLLRLTLASAATSLLASAVLVPARGGLGAALAYVGALAVLAAGVAAALLRHRA